MPLTITRAGPADMDLVRTLFREYQAFLNVDLCFQDFEGELAGLPGKYAEPEGVILLAREDDGAAAGVVALRPLDEDGVCEMKRLWLRSAWRGRGVGRLLAEAVVEEARQRGYRFMRLDTLRRLEAARGIYAGMGFRDIPAYYGNPLDGVVYMECDLKETAGQRTRVPSE